MLKKDPIVIVIPYNPVAKGRARQGRNHHYTPYKTRNFEALVEQYGRQVMGKSEPITGACRMHLYLYREIPASWSNTKKEKADSDMIFPTTKPDSSNILKAVEDALNGVVWKDDSQIVDHVVSKRYSKYPSLVIEVYIL